MKKPELTGLQKYGERYLPLVRKYRAVIIVLLAGVLLAAGGGGGKPAEAAQTDTAAPNDAYDLAAFEQRLSEKLTAIEGAGRVELMLSLEQTEESVYAVDTRQTQHTGEVQNYERSLAVISDGSHGQKPVTIKSMQPTFRGAVVLCDGADDVQVRLAVTRAVSAVCGIGADKITVLKMANGS